MPRGTHHVVTGLLLDGAAYPVLHVDDGGQWRLDLPGRYRRLIGRRVIVEGVRAGFDLLDVSRLTEIDPR